MTNKHTPGPWLIVRERGDINIVSDTVPYVAQVFPCPAVDVDYNARLIAAAPDLLAALEDALDAVEFHCIGKYQTASGPKLIDVIRAAIAKAKGD